MVDFDFIKNTAIEASPIVIAVTSTIIAYASIRGLSIWQQQIIVKKGYDLASQIMNSLSNYRKYINFFIGFEEKHKNALEKMKENGIEYDTNEFRKQTIFAQFFNNPEKSIQEYIHKFIVINSNKKNYLIFLKNYLVCKLNIVKKFLLSSLIRMKKKLMIY